MLRIAAGVYGYPRIIRSIQVIMMQNLQTKAQKRRL